MENAPTPVVPRGELERTVEEWHDQSGYPAVSAALTDGTERLLATGVGQADPASGRLATGETPHAVGSVAKAVTATAVLTLVDRGEVALDDPVSAYVPFLEDVPGEPITIHELLSHTSGMPHDDSATVMLQNTLKLGDAPPLDDWNAFESYLAETTDRRQLDDQFRYYNSGYATLGRLIERVTGQSFPAYVESAVFEPLGMDDSSFAAATAVSDDRIATPHAPGDAGLEPTPLPETPVFAPPGGLVAPVTDLTTFLAAHSNGTLPIATELCRRAHDPVAVTEEYAGGRERTYGYGWFRRPFDGDTLVSHSGGTFASSGFIGFLEDRGLGVAVSCNAANGPSPSVVARELLCLATGRELADVRPGQAVAAKARRVTGQYTAAHGVVSATVEWTGDRLAIEEQHLLGSERVEFVPASTAADDHTWVHTDDDGERVTATFDMSGESVTLEHAWRVFERTGPVDGPDNE
jgi:CubicO group peptidase (beta-lactamase class C family)